MHVHRSNRMESLAAALAEVVRAPAEGASPFDRECIVVQGRGMERWLSMRLASEIGVWANPWFPFPRTLLEEAFAVVLGESEDERRWSPEAATWSIAALLSELAARDEMTPIRRYLEGGDEAARRLSLASRIAGVFDQYVVYRPSMIRRWERGDDGDLRPGERWQPMLWRALMEREGYVHLAHRAEAFYHALREGHGPVEGLPRRISLFGISALPPRYLRMFVALSQRIDVHLFMMSPSAEYWADVRSRREELRQRARRTGETELADDLHFEEGHPLLASLGKVGRDFQAVLESIDDYADSDVDLYQEPAGGTLLHSLQRDMLHLSEGTPALDPHDGTVRVHSCHGPMREIEVLHDQLLALLADDPTLEPQDIVVMTPDIDAYAPVIEAVFERPADDPTQLPYRVADRGVRATHPVVDAFEDMLDVLAGRMPASAVLDLLGATPVREKFGIDAADIETVRRWVTESGIRWGVDAAHRAEEGQPADGQNTWRFGLDRLLVGWAVDARDDRVCAGVSPYDDVEGSAGELLGRLVSFCETLFSLRDAVAGERSPGAWRGVLSEVIERALAATPDTANEHQLVRRTLADMAERAEQAGFDEPVGLRALRPLLAEAMDRDVPVRSFLSGGITFCQLVPMRSIPFRVVCLVGMNDDAFPRAQRSLGFDLTAPPRSALGDRTPRDDDRYLFLEALLSARDRLLVTYVGQSIHDNAQLPPSVLVSEMIDALARPLPVDEREPFREALVVRHPLQPFSPRYFDGSTADLFGYSPRHAAGARALLGERRPAPPFMRRPLDDGDGDEGREVITLDELERFFKRPLPTFLQRRLGLYLGDDAEPIPDREPIELDGLSRWHVGDRVVARALRDGRTDAAAEAVRASGALPLGRAGEVEWDRIAPVAEEVVSRALRLVPGAPVEPMVLETELAGATVRGVIRQLRPEGQLDVRYSRLGRGSELALWIRHLALGVEARGFPMRSVLVGRGDKGDARAVWFGDVAHPRSLLEDLVHIYRIGQRAPLLLFESASRAFAERVHKGDAVEAAWRSARKKYDDWDSQDAHVRQVFGDLDPVAPGFDPFAGELEGYPLFDALAERVWGPLLAHRSETAPDEETP